MNQATRKDLLHRAIEQVQQLKAKLTTAEVEVAALKDEVEENKGPVMTAAELRPKLASVPVKRLRAALYDFQTEQLCDEGHQDALNMVADLWWGGCFAINNQTKQSCIDELVQEYAQWMDGTLEEGETWKDWCDRWLTDNDSKLK